MKILLPLLLFISVVIEATLIPFPITLVMIMLLLFLRSDHVVLFAFIFGILLDLFSLRILGMSSLYFLLACWIRQKYGQKFSAGSLVFQLPYFLIVVVGASYLFYRYINIWYLSAVVVLSFLAFLLFRQYFPEKNYKKRLKVE